MKKRRMVGLGANTELDKNEPVEVDVTKETLSETAVSIEETETKETKALHETQTPRTGTGTRKIRMLSSGVVTTAGARKAALLIARKLAKYAD